MRKIIAMLLAFAMLLTLAACGRSAAGNDTGSATGQEQTGHGYTGKAATPSTGVSGVDDTNAQSSGIASGVADKSGSTAAATAPTNGNTVAAAADTKAEIAAAASDKAADSHDMAAQPSADSSTTKNENIAANPSSSVSSNQSSESSKSDTDKPTSGTAAQPNQSAAPTKPTTGTTSIASSNTVGTTGNVSSVSSPASTTGSTSHAHSWEPVYELLPVYEMQEVTRCSTCEANIGLLSDADFDLHVGNHMLAGEGGGWYTTAEQVQVGTEEQLAGYRCSSCGEEK